MFFVEAETPLWLVIRSRRSSGNRTGTPVVFNLKNPFDFLECATYKIINIVVWQASNKMYSLGCFVFLAFFDFVMC